MITQTSKMNRISICIVCLYSCLFFACSKNSQPQKSQDMIYRMSAMEDRLEILTLLSGSAFSSDVASSSYWDNMFTEQAVFDRGGGKPNDIGKGEILKIIKSPDQLVAIENGMMHLSMLPHIKLNGDSAIATGCLLIVMPDSAASHVKLPGKGISTGFSIYQLTVNRWELIRTNTGWKVNKRTVRPILSTDSRALLQSAIEY